MKINKARYQQAINRSLKMAVGKGSDWAMNFSHALRIHGLMIWKPSKDFDVSIYPKGGPVEAPHPFLRGEYRLCKVWEEGDVIVWIQPGDHRQHRIACAAIRGKDGFLLLGYRHYDQHMFYLIRNCKNPENYRSQFGANQGFVDHLGVYHTRREAFKIAKAAGQLKNGDDRVQHLLRGKELHSELLY